MCGHLHCSYGEQVNYRRPAEARFAETLLAIQGLRAQRLLHSFLVRTLQPHIRDCVMLEAGCGSGLLTKKLLAFSPRMIVAGDLNPVFLYSTQSLTSTAESSAYDRTGKSALTLVRLDLSTGLPFAEATFDFVVCSSVLMHLPPEVSTITIRSLARLLKPKGGLVLAVLDERFANMHYPLAPERGEFARVVRTASGADQLIEHYPPVDRYREALRLTALPWLEHELIDDGSPDLAESAIEPPSSRSPLWRIFLAGDFVTTVRPGGQGIE